MVICYLCSEDINIEEINNLKLYLTPFDSSNPVNVCESCLTSEIYDSFTYCDKCLRLIKNSNALRKYIRHNKGENICVSCYQKICFNKGMESFNDGDFFDEEDLELHNFKKYISYHCKNLACYNIARKKFYELQEKYLVIVNIDSSGHIEHHITIFIRKPYKKIKNRIKKYFIDLKKKNERFKINQE